MTTPPDASPRSGAGADRAFELATAGAAWLVLILLGATAASMAWGGRLAFETFGWSFVTGRDWDAVGGRFGALVPIYGTLVTSFLALFIAVPVSIGIALFLTDIAPRWMRGPIGIAIELLAAIPSIIYGMWGLFVFAPFMAAHVEPWPSEHLGPLPVIGAAFSGPPTTPMTRAPAALPSWIAALPTPPAAACTSSASPACRPARRCSPNHPVW